MMGTLVWIFTLTLLFHLVTVHQCIWLDNIDCDVHPDYVETDTIRPSRYYPCIVELHRCTGANNADDLFRKKCVPVDDGIQQVDLLVYDMVHAKYANIRIANHTACYQVCAINATACTKYETFHTDECHCDCNYDHEPEPSPCHSPFQWDQTRCDCSCSIDPSTCEEKKIFNENQCGCFCKVEYQEKCSKSKKVLDPETCECLEPYVVGSVGDVDDHVVSWWSVPSLVIAVQGAVILGMILLLFYNKRRGYEKIGDGKEYN